MKFYIETYGCAANFGNSQELRAALIEMGHQPASERDADAVIVNTCAVTEKTERKIIRRLVELQGTRLVVVGCLPSALPGSLRQIERRGCMGPVCGARAKGIIDLFVPAARQRAAGTQPEADRLDGRQDSCGIVNIAEGCNGSCSYCIVRRARGRLTSRSLGEVVEAVRKLVRFGIVEVQLTAQDTAAYGSDIGTNLPTLLGTVAQVPGDFMVRLGMMNPDSALLIQRELIEAMHSPKIYRFLHMPVQSGSDRVLKRMGRRYLASDLLDIAGAFRANFREISISTDVIVGFPGENDDDFNETMGLISLLQPDKVNITRFSRRPGTAAARLYDMPDRIKKDRSRLLTRLWLETAARRNRRYEGRTLEALVTECGRGKTMKARSANYAGIVIYGAPRLGSVCKVDIVGSNPFYLKGILAPEIR